MPLLRIGIQPSNATERGGRNNRGEADEEDGPIVHSTFDCGERKICGVDIYTGVEFGHLQDYN